MVVSYVAWLADQLVLADTIKKDFAKAAKRALGFPCTSLAPFMTYLASFFRGVEVKTDRALAFSEIVEV